jgi:hypothetical protein
MLFTQPCSYVSNCYSCSLAHMYLIAIHAALLICIQFDTFLITDMSLIRHHTVIKRKVLTEKAPSFHVFGKEMCISHLHIHTIQTNKRLHKPLLQSLAGFWAFVHVYLCIHACIPPNSSKNTLYSFLHSCVHTSKCMLIFIHAYFYTHSYIRACIPLYSCVHSYTHTSKVMHTYFFACG